MKGFCAVQIMTQVESVWTASERTLTINTSVIEYLEKFEDRVEVKMIGNAEILYVTPASVKDLT